MYRPRRYRALGAGVIRLRTHRLDGACVAVAQLEHLRSDVGPGRDAAGTGQVVCAVCARLAGLLVAVAVAQKPEDALGHVAGEGQAAELVVHHGHLVKRIVGVGTAVGERRHGAHEVLALADNPARTHDVVLGAVGNGDVAGGLGLAVDAQRAEGLVLVVLLARAVEHVVARDVHERDAVLGAGLGQQRRALGVGGPGGLPALGGLGGVDGGVGAAVDYDPVERPVDLRVVGGVREVELVSVTEVEGVGDSPLLSQGLHRAAELAVGAGDERAAGRHGDGVLQHGMMLVGLGELALGKRDGPVDAKLGVGEVHERIGPLELGRPVGVHEVRVGGAVLERLEGVAHAAGHVDGLGGVDDARADLAEALPRP